MRLTADQIARAQFWVHAHADPEIAADLLARGVVNGVFAAYSRVAALLEQWESADADFSGSDLRAAALARALSGDADDKAGG